MSKEWTLAESFAHFGCVGKNMRWSRSARSADGKTVAMGLWTDRLSRKKKPTTYEEVPGAPTPEWIGRPGNKERLENLVWARDKCEGIFRVVMVVAKDKDAEPREIADRFPKDDLVMQITHLDEITGQFSAVAVAPK